MDHQKDHQLYRRLDFHKDLEPQHVDADHDRRWDSLSLFDHSNISPQANLLIHLPKMREDHIKFTSELARYSNEVTTTFKETPRTDGENREPPLCGERSARTESRFLPRTENRVRPRP